jgi:hypothetical protein
MSFLHELIDYAKRTGKPWFILNEWHEKTLRVPRIPCGVWRKKRNGLVFLRSAQARNFVCGRAASMEQDHRTHSLRERGAKTERVSCIVKLHRCRRGAEASASLCADSNRENSFTQRRNREYYPSTNRPSA